VLNRVLPLSFRNFDAVLPFGVPFGPPEVKLEFRRFCLRHLGKIRNFYYYCIIGPVSKADSFEPPIENTAGITGYRSKPHGGYLGVIMYSVGIAYLLWFLSCFGIFGFHRLYLGKIPSAILWMCTCGLFGIGTIYDFLTLSGQVQEANLRKTFFKKRERGWRYADDGEAHIVREKESVERTILKLAKRNRGILTASELALEANIPMEEAKKNLDALVSRGFAEIRVRRSGVLVYTLPEMMDADEPLEDF
jgi:predicted transcriptional regulator